MHPNFSRNCNKGWQEKFFDMISEKCLQNSLYASDWFVLQFSRFCWNDPNCMPSVRKISSTHGSFRLNGNENHLFSASLGSYTVYCCLNSTSTTDNVRKFGHGKVERSEHPHVMQPEQHVYAKMELRVYQGLVQMH